jgi:hypothetical protein
MDSGMWKLESLWQGVESECEVAAQQHGAFLMAAVALMAEM